MSSIPWYVTAFRADYVDRYAHRNEAEAKANTRALVEWLPLRRTDSILDLACGAGRYLVALHQAGFTRLVGLDLSTDLLDRARNRLRELGISDVQLIHGDMRKIGLAGRFDTVLSLFSSFGYFADDPTNAAVIRQMAGALRTGGTVVIDTMNPPRVQATLVADEQFSEGDQHVHITRRITPERRVEKHVVLSRAGVRCDEFFESVRMYDGEEMTVMLEAAGFEDIRFAGALDGRVHSLASPRLVVAATKGSHA